MSSVITGSNGFEHLTDTYFPNSGNISSGTSGSADNPADNPADLLGTLSADTPFNALTLKPTTASFGTNSSSTIMFATDDLEMIAVIFTSEGLKNHEVGPMLPMFGIELPDDDKGLWVFTLPDLSSGTADLNDIQLHQITDGENIFVPEVNLSELTGIKNAVLGNEVLDGAGLFQGSTEEGNINITSITGCEIFYRFTQEQALQYLLDQKTGRPIAVPDIMPEPLPPTIPAGINPLTLTVNAHDGTFILPMQTTSEWIVDWGDDDVVTRVRNTSDTAHTYGTPGTYEINIYPENANTEAWLLPFGFKSYDDSTPAPSTGVNSLSNRQKVLHVDGVLVPEMFGTASQIAKGRVGNGICDHWFCGCSNLTMSDTFTFAGWEKITEVGGGFCHGMFKFCSGNNFTMGAAFNLPQNIQTILAGGTRYRYVNWYQVPAYAFCCAMFYGCSGANFAMNNIFTLPQSMIMTGAWFCTGMFRDCSGDAFTMGAAFNLPQKVTGLCAPGDNRTMGHVCESMFYNCKGAAFTMNSIFQIPPNLEYAGVQTFARMFFQCMGDAFTMNSIFTLPQNMQKAYSGLAYQMFQNCKGAAFTMNSVFKAPPNMTLSLNGYNHLGFMFYGCGSKSGSAFQVNNVFVFPALPQAYLDTTYESDGTTIKNRGAYYQTFAGITQTQNRLAASIIGANPVPLAPREAFGTGFTDIGNIDANWQEGA